MELKTSHNRIICLWICNVPASLQLLTSNQAISFGRVLNDLLSVTFFSGDDIDIKIG